MKWLFESTGGRKVFIAMVVGLIFVVSDWAGFSLADRTVEQLTTIAQWVIAAIAAEDVGTKVASAIASKNGTGGAR